MASTTETSRADHLAWCKERALEYVEIGDNAQAFASLVSDLAKHPDTKGHAAGELGLMLMLAGQLSTGPKMREFINGCN